jgi:hypothetical protein
MKDLVERPTPQEAEIAGVEHMTPVWPDWDTIARSLNVRGNLMARMMDDPLFGVPITQDMQTRALAYENWKATKARAHLQRAQGER